MRVLILSAATGGGHKQASQSLANIIKKKNPDATVKVEDALKYCGRFFDKTICGGYHFLATKATRLYGTVYKISDRETQLNNLVGAVNGKISKKLYPLFEEFKPDIVVSCHPFVTEMVAKLKELNMVTAPLAAVITDFAPHRAYIRNDVDAYVVANDEMVDILEKKYKVPKAKVHPLGIPINSAFYEIKDKAKIISGLGFSRDIPTLLIMAGSFGVTDILEIYENIVQIENKLQIIVITGRNKRLYNAFEALLKKTEPDYAKRADTSRRCIIHKPTKLFYFVNNVEDYMAVSDLIITKPGGLTATESLASCLPMLIFNSIPGQEEDNADYLVRHNTAIKLEKGSLAAYQVRELLNNPAQLVKMRESCKKYRKPNASEQIYELLTEMQENKSQN